MSNASPASKSARQRRMRLIQVLVVVGVLALAVFSFGQTVLSPGGGAGSLPQRLGNLELVSSVAGSQATAQVNRLHGTEIRLVTAFIGEYVFNRYESQRATVWVGIAEDPQSAAELLQRMLDGIARGGSGFSSPQRLTVGAQAIFQVDGPGGKHFFYQPREQGERVIWVSIEAPENSIRDILEQTVRAF